MRQQSDSVALIEIGVLQTVAAAMVGIYSSLASSVKSACERIKTDRLLRLTNDAMREFVLLKKRSSCPDLTGSGLEVSSSRTCPPDTHIGALTYVSLRLDLGSTPAANSIRFGVWYIGSGADLVQPGVPPAMEDFDK